MPSEKFLFLSDRPGRSRAMLSPFLPPLGKRAKMVVTILDMRGTNPLFQVEIQTSTPEQCWETGAPAQLLSSPCSSSAFLQLPAHCTGMRFRAELSSSRSDSEVRFVIALLPKAD